MVRFILKREQFDAHSGRRQESFHSLCIDVPELEHWLTGGGHGPSGFDYSQLVGVEITTNPGGRDD